MYEKMDFPQSEKKKKFALWIYPSTQKRILEIYKDDNCSSQSEFIEKAVTFYCGYISTNNSIEYLPKIIPDMISGIIQKTEDRIARLIFKLALEMCMMMHLFADLNDVPENYLNKLRGKCIKEVKSSIGAVNWDKVISTHDEFVEDLKN